MIIECGKCTWPSPWCPCPGRCTSIWGWRGRRSGGRGCEHTCRWGWSRPAAGSGEKLSPAGGKSAAAEFPPAHCDSLNGFSSSGLPEGCCPSVRRREEGGGSDLEYEQKQVRSGQFVVIRERTMVKIVGLNVKTRGLLASTCMVLLTCWCHVYKAASNVCSHESFLSMACQHPYRTQQVVCWMPIGWWGDYAGRSARVVLCSHTEAIFKASNHEPYTWDRSQEDAVVAYCISIKHIARDESTTTAHITI